MKIEIENLGPIKQFEFDIEKDFHIIYGENNIGKSYAINTIYILLKYLVVEPINLSKLISRHLLDQEKLPEIEDLNDIVNAKLTDEKYREFTITKKCEEILKKGIEAEYVTSISKSFKNSFSSFYNMRNKLSNKQLVLKILLRNFNLIIKLSKNNELYLDELQLKKRITVRFIDTNRNVKIEEDKIILYIKKSEFGLENFQKEILFVVHHEMENSIRSLKNSISDIYFFPASRSGLYQAMNIFSSVFAELSKVRHIVNSQISIPALSEPVSDYFLKLSTIKINTTSDKYAKIAKEMEKNLLNGEVVFNKETKKIEYVEKKTKLRLDLSETSSMVSEISPIVAYLKYVINEIQIKDDSSDAYNLIWGSEEGLEYNNSKKLIFIEEPEAHLHPKIQIKLIEYFSKLINNNIKIVLTTHSDFISNKLTNLILSEDLSFEKISSCHLIMTKEGSIDKGDMQATQEGIDDYNFLGVSEELYEERMKLSNPEN
ncbi:MAG: hypothetical protein B6I20_00655 [Bacteroidetes bacterium 4572_117]|nr:MAG: hypothetical protein B6I20_00655 [Bacteroidetes bacterium 4572_117]